MGYSFTDASKRCFEGPSISGWRNLYTLFEGRENKFPALAEIRKQGYTTRLKELTSECRELSKSAPKDVVVTLRSLAKSASEADELIILEM